MTIDEEITLLRSVAMLCVREGWHNRARTLDSVRYRLEEELRGVSGEVVDQNGISHSVSDA